MNLIKPAFAGLLFSMFLAMHTMAQVTETFTLSTEQKAKLVADLDKMGLKLIEGRELTQRRFAKIFGPSRTTAAGDDRTDPNATSLVEFSGTREIISTNTSGGPDQHLIGSGPLVSGRDTNAIAKLVPGYRKFIFDLSLVPFVVQDGGEPIIAEVYGQDNGRLLLRIIFWSSGMTILKVGVGATVRDFQDDPLAQATPMTRQEIRLGIFPATSVAIQVRTQGGVPIGGVVANWIRAQQQ